MDQPPPKVNNTIDSPTSHHPSIAQFKNSEEVTLHNEEQPDEFFVQVKATTKKQNFKKLDYFSSSEEIDADDMKEIEKMKMVSQKIKLNRDKILGILPEDLEMSDVNFCCW